MRKEADGGYLEELCSGRMPSNVSAYVRGRCRMGSGGHMGELRARRLRVVVEFL